MTQSENGVRVVLNDEGRLVTVSNLTDEQYETLKALFESPAWKLYRILLVQMKEGYFHATLPMKDPNEILKTIGHVAGINLAVNQLGVLVAAYNNSKAKAVQSGTKNSAKP